MVQRLLADPHVEVNKAVTTEYHAGETPLYIACYMGHDAVVQRLLANPRVEVNKAANGGRTPLRIAKDKGHAAIVAALQQAGAK